MKTGFLVGLLVPTALVATAALADDKAACLDAASKGQRLRDTHKLAEAREQLRVCAAAHCPAVVQSDCANWLADVEKALPSVVLSAKTAAGADLVDVKVSVDGQPLVSKLDGQAVSMNAGPHTFHFEGVDGTGLDLQRLLKEGEKNQAVAVVLGAAPPAPSASQGTVPAPEAPSRSSSPWKTVGWVLGGVGVAGLGVGTVFGVLATGDKTRAHCDANNVCDPGTVSGIKSAALVSDVGWIAGGVLLASGAALVLFAPSASRKPTEGVGVVPVVTARGGEIVARGTW
jgi:hypothetical protein